MSITGALVLPADVVLLPVEALAGDLRRRFAHAAGDVALTHPHSRAPSRILDARAAELVAGFRRPSRVVDVVLGFSRAHGADPAATLEEAYPLVRDLLAAGLLVTEGAAEAAAERPALVPGDEVGGFVIRECVRHIEDTEVYLASGPMGSRGSAARASLAAVKIARPAATGRLAAAFAREAAVLDALGGVGAPRLYATGTLPKDGRPWIAMEWIAGVDVLAAGREGLPALLHGIAAAFAALHARGVIHGDVHPRNVLVERSGAVRLIDFGQAGGIDPGATPARAGVVFFHEPELAAAERTGAPLPAASFAGEQYALGALLYLVAAGAHYRDFSLERGELLRQITQDPPLPFAERGIAPWPALEAVLARALAKDPGARFASVAELAAALAQIDAPRAASGWTRPPDAVALDDLLARFLDRVGEGGALYATGLPPPTASVTHGAAGIACALYRIALARDDAALLSLSDLWAERAAAAAGPPESFYAPDRDVDVRLIGATSAYHTAPGIHAVRVLAGHALGLSGASLAGPVDAFLEAARAPCPSPDLVFGRSGLLLTCALLLDALGGADDDASRRALLCFGGALLDDLWAGDAAALDRKPPIDDDDDRPGLGMAHGWAGCLYATLRFAAAAGIEPPAGVARRLDELAACARPAGRGLRWKWQAAPGGIASMAGWCNGSAGMVFLYRLAAGRSGERAYCDVAEGAAFHAWEAAEGGAGLCCGLAGRAYALLDLHRAGGGGEWLERARALAGLAARQCARNGGGPDGLGLYHGEAGVAALAADLLRPGEAAMPFFGAEGWQKALGRSE